MSRTRMKKTAGTVAAVALVATTMGVTAGTAPTGDSGVNVAPQAAEAAKPKPPLPTARKITAIYNKVKSKNGAPYKLGAKGPTYWDCSGIIAWAYKEVTGKTFAYGGTYYQEFNNPNIKLKAKKVSVDNLPKIAKKGDIVFFYTYVVEAPKGKTVHSFKRNTPELRQVKGFADHVALWHNYASNYRDHAVLGAHGSPISRVSVAPMRNWRSNPNIAHYNVYSFR